ncbi:hypothetical protein EAS64_25770 [Trebonia kvetii]|uniref:CYTH domain-containing protein n=1 Tax=Trebonia kvetii TaxID=2480626 RepID=A0A6P2BVR9_9ACTN|nr:hypothetical protein [Trebonia kvetii]TVZ02235.1 hypothetical protein EAS64_25770 [Trebonia kvetii]
MTVVPTEIPTVGAVDTLEVRWIAAGPLVAQVRQWFGRFPTGTEVREDAYLLLPRLPGLSVKLRDGVSLDVKSYLGCPGVIDRLDSCRGRLEYWRKWSFRCEPVDHGDVLPVGWTTVSKRRLRTWFPMPASEAPAGSLVVAEAGCAVELAQVQLRGEPWWSVGFEATGPLDLLRGALEHAADIMFALPPPAGVEFSLDTSKSYAKWLTEHPNRMPVRA